MVYIIAFWSWGVGFCRERKIPGLQQGKFQQGLQPTTISTHMIPSAVPYFIYVQEVGKDSL